MTDLHANKAPIWRDSQRLLVLEEEAVPRFPRYHKYTLRSDLRRQALHICRLVNRAWRDQQGRLRHIEDLVMAVDESSCSCRRARRFAPLPVSVSFSNGANWQWRWADKVVGGVGACWSGRKWPPVEGGACAEFTVRQCPRRSIAGCR